MLLLYIIIIQYTITVNIRILGYNVQEAAMSKRKSIVLLVITGLLIVFFGVACFANFALPDGLLKFFGAQPKYNYVSVFDQISKGIDLEGGYYAVMTPTVDEDDAEINLDNVIQTLRTRLDDKGYTEATIARQDVNSLRVEIPDVDDADEVLELLSSQGKLEFRDKSGTVWLNGDHISDAYVGRDNDGDYAVVLNFTSAGQKRWATATETVYNGADSDKKIYIYLGDTLVSEPVLQGVLTDASAMISGSFGSDAEGYERAETLAAVISSGALDIEFSIGETRQVSATLGEGVVSNALIAAGIGMLIIFAILILFYGGMGIAASLALMIYVILYVIILALFPWVQLTFPGIAGIILSIGMAVDANVIIFERIKEEYASGKTVENAIKVGFKRAFITVFDSNITTILASIVLWILSSGSIQGFAITLFLGVIISMFSSIVVTRWMIKVLKPLAKEQDKFYNLVRREA